MSIKRSETVISTGNQNKSNNQVRRHTKGFAFAWAARLSDSDSDNDNPIKTTPVGLSDIKITEYKETPIVKRKATILYLGTQWCITDNPPEDWTKKDLHNAMNLWVQEHFRN